MTATELHADAGADLALQTVGVGKRFRSGWALRDCSVTVPRGHVSALVGPNGAGKTTLLRLLVGLAAPTEGQLLVFGHRPAQDPAYLADIGYLAQEAPLYRRLSAGEHLALGRRLNPRWDDAQVRERLAELRIPLERPVGTLSGGQRGQVALGLALAKRPRLLLLDEPVAALDPLARREFLTSLALATAVEDLTVVLSSHLVHDIEQVCDHLVLLTDGSTRLSADIDTVLAEHRLLVGPRRPTATVRVPAPAAPRATVPSPSVPGATVIDAVEHDRQTRLVVRLDRPVLDPAWQVEELSLEEIILAYLNGRPPLPTRPRAVARRAS